MSEYQRSCPIGAEQAEAFQVLMWRHLDERVKIFDEAEAEGKSSQQIAAALDNAPTVQELDAMGAQFTNEAVVYYEDAAGERSLDYHARFICNGCRGHIEIDTTLPGETIQYPDSCPNLTNEVTAAED